MKTAVFAALFAYYALCFWLDLWRLGAGVAILVAFIEHERAKRI